MKSLSFRYLCATCLMTAALTNFGVPAVQAHDEDDHKHEPVLAADLEVWKPSAVPDRIVLSWKEAPATTQAVNWRTDTSVYRAYAEVAKATAGPIPEADSKRYNAKTSLLLTSLHPAHYHSVNFRELEPATKYAYRVGDGVNWSEWSHFTTASEENKPFTFVYFGDAQNDLKSHWSRIVREAFKDAPRAAFFLHAGDLINDAHNDANWGEWFYSGGFINRTTPVIAVPGNHEYFKEKGDDGEYKTYYLTKHWRPTFTFPEHGPSDLEESVFYIDYQGVRIVAMNSNERLDEQAEWLDKVLANNPNQWTILTFHHPIYSPKAGRDNPTLRAKWQPTIDKYKVDLVLQGHDHTYSRTKLMKAGDYEPTALAENQPSGEKGQKDETGTMYVVSVSGPKMYDLGRQPFMRRAAEDTQLYQIITVDGDKLKYEARTAIGEKYDGFTLQKREGKPNKLIEQVPDTPENRREPAEEEEKKE
ncbi:Calcineurin-like phosphoesterase [Polystyrenella longa]|uniref:Calcineurin-like phosphoesterase n=1 Tax=Polystyrenella longa TaxID=2528007 RepID=A0A518CR05_9PLAN|nr:metallophosphoesterase family protein [Polystyrenella longa]QDU81640.1 Calcineurin-like phosphoesterase [Polystyrenella longa]